MEVDFSTVYELNRSMSTSANVSLPLDDFTDRISFALHGPNHEQFFFVRREMLECNHFPMTARDVSIEFLMYSKEELESIRFD